MRGRKPKPSKLRLIQGNAGHRPLNGAEAVAPAEIPDAPDYLSAAARAEWARTAPLLRDAGLLSRLDAQAFGRLCQLTARLAQAEQGLADHGMLVRSPEGFPMPSPYLGIVNTTSKHLITLCSEFGLTPSSRARIRVDEQPMNDSFDAYLRESPR